MKKVLLKLLIFLIPAIIYSITALIIMPTLLLRVNGPTVKQQITWSFQKALKRDYRLLILGNSRTYRGLNPDIFSIKAFNFSFDYDSYNQIYYKLEYLKNHNKKFDYLILGVDYFQFGYKFEDMNYVYFDFLGKNYICDYENNNKLLLKMDYYFNIIGPNKLYALLPKSGKSFLRENGQIIYNGKAKENDTITRDIHRIAFQENYFKKIIKYCNTNRIKVFILMLPTRQNELINYSQQEMNEFNEFINSFIDNSNVFFLNYCYSNDFKLEDYTDITHFNEAAADRFSRMVTNDINNKILSEAN